MVRAVFSQVHDFIGIRRGVLVKGHQQAANGVRALRGQGAVEAMASEDKAAEAAAAGGGGGGLGAERHASVPAPAAPPCAGQHGQPLERAGRGRGLAVEPP
jgi:hypothetical protein